MPTKHKNRKPGDWKTVAQGRLRVERVLLNGRGITNIPSISDVGSAAYRRLRAKGKAR